MCSELREVTSIGLHETEGILIWDIWSNFAQYKSTLQRLAARITELSQNIWLSISGCFLQQCTNKINESNWLWETLVYIACIYYLHIHTAAAYCLNETININLELLCLELMLQSEWKGHFVKTSIHILLTLCNVISAVVLFAVNTIIVWLPVKAN